jgi:hypothetical protein
MTFPEKVMGGDINSVIFLGVIAVTVSNSVYVLWKALLLPTAKNDLLELSDCPARQNH